LKINARILKLGATSALLSMLGALGLTGIQISFASPVEEYSIPWNSPNRDSSSVFYEEFKDLEVTVSQVENLTNQGVLVQWRGMAPSVNGGYTRNYMQVMQCWGNETNAIREGCQWGTPLPATQNLVGPFASNRELNEGEDPLQEYVGSSFQVPPPSYLPDLKMFRVPFQPVGEGSTFAYEQFFAPQSTNEVTAAPVGPDGTGSLAFEIQTSLEAPHLGCGRVLNGSPVNCWLVLVPRGAHYLNGTPVAQNDSISGSPLSATNWNNRIEIPLDFAPLSTPCPIGTSERRVVGSELVSEAVTSWQPALCQDVATFGYSQIGDGEARRQIVSNIEGSAGLAFINKPLTAEEAGDTRLVYTPVASSAIVIAYNIENQFLNTSQFFSENGKQASSLKLNARLLAKLLTQSYRSDVPGGNLAPHVANNPRSLRQDPEFLALNPRFADFVNNAEPGGLVVPLGSSDVASLLWQWVRADDNAVSFLAGNPDPYGMVINSYYKNLALNTDLEIESFPKADLTMFVPSIFVPEPGFSTLDYRPYSHDLFDTALMLRRADPKSRSIWDTTRTPAQFVSPGAQPTGQRFLMGVTDLPSAKRFGLNTVTLVRSDGSEVNAIDEDISAALSSFVEDPSSKMLVRPSAPSAFPGYPLSTLTYAVTSPCTQTADAVGEYASFLEYATTGGQTIGSETGQLPEGYLPLSVELKQKAQDSISVLKSPGIQVNCPEITTLEPENPADNEPTAQSPTSDVEESPVSSTADGDTPEVAEPKAIRNTIAYRTTTQLSGSPLFSNLLLSAAFLGLPSFLIGNAAQRRSGQKSSKF
jgi:ABC-type phosphate transport system substrate-binding protein